MRAALFLALGAIAGAGVTLALPRPLLAQAQPAAPQGSAPARPGGNELLRVALPDMPGKQLVVLPLRFPPTGVKAPPHQHPGSVYVYVTKGAARLGVEGQEPRVVSAGQGFFEPVGAIHNIDENVGAEPATAIAFMIVPDGAPLASVVQGHAGH